MKLLLICTGNTCRSPMAMALAQSLGHEAKSAGVSVGWEGMPASDGAERAMQRRGLSLASHRSHQCTQADMLWADRIICMTASHCTALLERWPEHAGKLTVFPTPIPDPYGGGDDEYERAAALIENQLARLL